MDNQENGITLGQLFAVFKKNLIRGLIYILICAVLATSLLILIRSFTSTNVYEAGISFQTADETALSSMNLNKTSMVNKALSADKKPLTLSNEVVKNLTITAIIPEKTKKSTDEENDVIIPTSFKVSLKSSADLNFSSGEYKSIVDYIAKECVNRFAVNSMPAISRTNTNVDSMIANKVEYMQIASELSDAIETYLFTLNSFVSSTPAAKNFTADTGKTISDVITDLNYVKSSLNNVKYSVITNKYGLGNLSGYISASKISADMEASKYQKIYNDAKDVLDSYESTVKTITQNVNGNNVYMFDDTVFVSLTERALAASAQYAEAVKKQSEITSYAALVGDAAGTKNTEIENELKSFATTLNSVVMSYESLSTEFNNNKISISPAIVSKPANAVAESPISLTIIVLADVAVVLIAYIVSFAQTYSIMKKKGELN